MHHSAGQQLPRPSLWIVVLLYSQLSNKSVLAIAHVLVPAVGAWRNEKN